MIPREARGTDGLPEGISIPSLLSLRYYAHTMDMIKSRRADALSTRDRATINRLDALVRLEFAWAIIHSWALERYWNLRVPVYNMRFLAWV